MTTRPRSDGDPGAPLVLWEVQQTARVAGRLFERAMTESGITAAEYGVLACIADDPGTSQAQIARELAIRPQALTRTITNLRDSGQISATSHGRGRVSGLRLTESGRAALNRAWPRIVDLNSPRTLDLESTAIHQLIEHLRTLRANLKTLETKSTDDC